MLNFWKKCSTSVLWKPWKQQERQCWTMVSAGCTLITPKRANFPSECSPAMKCFPFGRTRNTLFLKRLSACIWWLGIRVQRPCWLKRLKSTIWTVFTVSFWTVQPLFLIYRALMITLPRTLQPRVRTGTPFPWIGRKFPWFRWNTMNVKFRFWKRWKPFKTVSMLCCPILKTICKRTHGTPFLC